MSRIYISSSWSNPYQPDLVKDLRDRGHLVYDFRHPQGRHDRSVWDEIGVTEKLFHDSLTGEVGLSGGQLDEALRNDAARRRFDEHLAAMQDADTCVLLLPCGRSSHIEAGYMAGLGKRVFVFGSQFDIHKPELMYLTLDGFFFLYEDLFAALDEPIPGVCRVCGCTEANPCYHPDHGNCWWVEPSLCSHCAEKLLVGGRYYPSIKDDPRTQHCIHDHSNAFRKVL